MEEKRAKHGKFSNNAVWDCGSSLYDSFEREAVEKQLNSAIAAASRTMSMPHITNHYFHAVPPPPPKKKEPSAPRISRSFRRLIRSVFGTKSTRKGQTKTDADSTATHARASLVETRVMSGGGALSTIPEAPEMDEFSPLVRRTTSERFNATTVGVYC